MKGISTLLMLSLGPAEKGGLQVLHQFLHHGYNAFKRLGKADNFILPIIHSEQQLMNALFDPASTNPLPDIPVSPWLWRLKR
ncbi:MAG: hypothetical protein ACI8R9_000240 [Paraglaciecola sp.]|jgi:hypothetical protein